MQKFIKTFERFYIFCKHFIIIMLNSVFRFFYFLVSFILLIFFLFGVFFYNLYIPKVVIDWSLLNDNILFVFLFLKCYNFIYIFLLFYFVFKVKKPLNILYRHFMVYLMRFIICLKYCILDFHYYSSKKRYLFFVAFSPLVIKYTFVFCRRLKFLIGCSFLIFKHILLSWVLYFIRKIFYICRFFFWFIKSFFILFLYYVPHDFIYFSSRIYLIFIKILANYSLNNFYNNRFPLLFFVIFYNIVSIRYYKIFANFCFCIFNKIFIQLFCFILNFFFFHNYSFFKKLLKFWRNDFFLGFMFLKIKYFFWYVLKKLCLITKETIFLRIVEYFKCWWFVNNKKILDWDNYIYGKFFNYPKYSRGILGWKYVWLFNTWNIILHKAISLLFFKKFFIFLLKYTLNFFNLKDFKNIYDLSFVSFLFYFHKKIKNLFFCITSIIGFLNFKFTWFILILNFMKKYSNINYFIICLKSPRYNFLINFFYKLFYLLNCTYFFFFFFYCITFIFFISYVFFFSFFFFIQIFFLLFL